MADEDPGKDPGEDADDDLKAAAKGSNKLIIILAVTLVLVIGGGAGAFFMFSGDDAEMAVTDGEGETGEGNEEAEEEVVPGSSDTQYYSLGPEFIVNFTDKAGKVRFLKAELSLAVDGDDMLEHVAKHTPAIRNTLILLLSRQVYEELIGHEGKEQLRATALEEVRKIMKKRVGKSALKGVEDLYFTSFVMQ